jgi:hypothetical protein
MRRIHLLPLLSCLLLLAGCSNVKLGRTASEPDHSRPAHWKSDPGTQQKEGLGGLFDAIIHGSGGINPGASPAAFYRQSYQLWRHDHATLERTLARNQRGSLDTMRRIVGSLGGMKEMLQDEEQREELTRLQLRYQSIAEKSTGGFKPAAFSLAMDRIKWRIEKRFAPGTEGLVFRPASYFREQEEEEFLEPEVFE